jgi:hypothetical protein
MLTEPGSSIAACGIDDAEFIRCFQQGGRSGGGGGVSCQRPIRVGQTFGEELACTGLALSTAGCDGELFAQLGHRGAAIAHGFPDLPIGDGVAYADVHLDSRLADWHDRKIEMICITVKGDDTVIEARRDPGKPTT